MKQKKTKFFKRPKSFLSDQDIPGKNYRKEPKESIVEIVKEDILRIVGEERSKKVRLKFIKSKIKASSSFISESIRELKRDGLIRLDKKFLRLTEKGRDEAEYIIKKHSVLEEYFKKKRGGEEAHKAADILEHYVSVEVLNNIKKLSTFKGEDLPLLKFELNREDLITDIEFPSSGLFERIVSMGILPGEKIRIVNKIPDGIVVNVSGKKFALGEDIARGIRVLG
ncbi:MAG: metal-dependent transcriptional regulator [Candidatus Ranarchaeia archaeon]